MSLDTMGPVEIVFGRSLRRTQIFYFIYFYLFFILRLLTDWIVLFQSFVLWLCAALRMKTELTWLPHWISTGLVLFHIAHRQKKSDNTSRHSSTLALNNRESSETGSCLGHLQPWWTKRGKERKKQQAVRPLGSPLGGPLKLMQCAFIESHTSNVTDTDHH